MNNVFRLIFTSLAIMMASLAVPALAGSLHAADATAPEATKDSPLVLYYRDDCPYCWNVLSHLSDQHRTLPVKEINESTEAASELVQGGGKRQVPCLRIRENNGNKVTWLYQSTEIIKYLDEHPQ